MIEVIPVTSKTVKPWLLSKHYARRMCPISYAFGAYRKGHLIGIVTYGTPASAPLRSGICGPAYAKHVLELNRLCCNTEKNLASIIVGKVTEAAPAAINSRELRRHRSRPRWVCLPSHEFHLHRSVCQADRLDHQRNGTPPRCNGCRREQGATEPGGVDEGEIRRPFLFKRQTKKAPIRFYFGFCIQKKSFAEIIKIRSGTVSER